jgi:dolichol-phosphate mannosyltransferase
MPEISVILPTYNEAENILDMIEHVEAELNGVGYEILVVDDDSPDGTSRIVSENLSRFSNLRLITRKENRGLVPAINEGIRNAEGDVCLWMDADLSMPAATIKALLAEVNAGADIAVGSRYVEGGGFKGADLENRSLYRTWRNLKNTEDSFLSVAISWVGNKAVRFFLDSAYHDYTSGFYAVRRPVFDRVMLEGRHLEYCIRFLFTAVRSGFCVVEVPVVIEPRKRGVSKTANDLQTLIPIAADCFRTIIDLFMMDRRGWD